MRVKGGRTMVEVPSGTFVAVRSDLVELVDFYRVGAVWLTLDAGAGERTRRRMEVWMHHGQGYRHAPE
jgi:hypothetical protein